MKPTLGKVMCEILPYDEIMEVDNDVKWGVVSAIGKERSDYPLDYKIGDRVLLPAHKGRTLDLDGKKYLLCWQWEVDLMIDETVYL
jgi:co-chaperonin GroES (HSP10)